MSYGEYKDSGKSTGKLLYQLSKIGVPVTVIQSVIFESSGEISYEKKPFASYKWCITETPIFTFAKEHEHYNKLKQPEVMSMQDLIKQGDVYRSGLKFYLDQCKKISKDTSVFPTLLVQDKGSIAEYCLNDGKAKPSIFVQSILNHFSHM